LVCTSQQQQQVSDVEVSEMGMFMPPYLLPAATPAPRVKALQCVDSTHLGKRERARLFLMGVTYIHEEVDAD
jgi:hypothetical protein